MSKYKVEISGINTNDIVCVYVGRMTREKGLLTLEKMFATHIFPNNIVFLFDYKDIILKINQF